MDKHLVDLIAHEIGIGGVCDTRYEAFITCPASIKFHSCFRGGLAAHTTGMIRLAQEAKKGVLKLGINLESVDWQIVFTAIVLHDALKIFELIPCADKYIRRNDILPHQVSVVLELFQINRLYNFIDEITLVSISNIILSTHTSNTSFSVEAKLLKILDGLECALSRCGYDITNEL